MTEQKTERSGTRVRGFNDAEMDFQLIRHLGSTAYRGASIGECLALAATCRDAEPSDWVARFAAMGQRLEKDAETRLRRTHRVSAADQYIRACNAWRAAEYYTDVSDPHHKEYGIRSRECFLAAMRAEDRTCEILEIAYQNQILPGYFLAAGPDRGRTLIAVSGFDGTLEETFIQTGDAALQRGYNLLLLAGPGQMDTFRFNAQTCFEPDYETPLGLFLDYLDGRKEIDSARLGLIGISFGGYFAARAASRDARIKALVANSPIVDLHDYMAGFVGFDPARMPDEQDFTLDDLPQISDTMMNAQMKATAANLIRRFGCRSFKETFTRLRDFTVQDHLGDIQCPCLGLVGEGEGTEPRRQYDLFVQQAGRQNQTVGKVFTAEEGTDSHCQVGNLAYANAVIFDWLDELFA